MVLSFEEVIHFPKWCRIQFVLILKKTLLLLNIDTLITFTLLAVRHQLTQVVEVLRVEQSLVLDPSYWFEVAAEDLYLFAFIDVYHHGVRILLRRDRVGA